MAAQGAPAGLLFAGRALHGEIIEFELAVDHEALAALLIDSHDVKIAGRGLRLE